MLATGWPAPAGNARVWLAEPRPASGSSKAMAEDKGDWRREEAVGWWARQGPVCQAGLPRAGCPHGHARSITVAWSVWWKLRLHDRADLPLRPTPCSSMQPTSPLQTCRTEFLTSKKDKRKLRVGKKAEIPNKQILGYQGLLLKAVTKTKLQLQLPHCKTIHMAWHYF